MRKSRSRTRSKSRSSRLNSNTRPQSQVIQEYDEEIANALDIVATGATTNPKLTRTMLYSLKNKQAHIIAIWVAYKYRNKETFLEALKDIKYHGPGVYTYLQSILGIQGTLINTNDKGLVRAWGELITLAQKEIASNID